MKSHTKHGEQRLSLSQNLSAFFQGKPSRASGEMAYHVLDIIQQMMISSEENRPVTVSSTCRRPDALTAQDIQRLIG